jgi:hypothetical protein
MAKLTKFQPPPPTPEYIVTLTESEAKGLLYLLDSGVIMNVLGGLGLKSLKDVLNQEIDNSKSKFPVIAQPAGLK